MTTTSETTKRSLFTTITSRPPLALLWGGYLAAAIVLLEFVPRPAYLVVVAVIAVALSVLSARLTPGIEWVRWSPRSADLLGLVVLYAAIVGLFRLAFGVFTTANTAGLFLAFAGGLALGVVGPLVHLIRIRRRNLSSLGLTLDRLPQTLALALGLAALQAVLLLGTVSFGVPDVWLPILVMSLVVGFFEAVFFRGYVLAVVQPAFGLVPAIAASAALYALYHVGYGMDGEVMLFLAGLGIVYGIAFALARNILVLWPLLTPVGGFVSNVRDGDLSLPLVSVLGFGWLLAGMFAAVYLASRWEHGKLHKGSASTGGRRGGARAVAR